MKGSAYITSNEIKPLLEAILGHELSPQALNNRLKRDFPAPDIEIGEGKNRRMIWKKRTVLLFIEGYKKEQEKKRKEN